MENTTNEAADTDVQQAEAAERKGWNSVLYGIPDGDTPRRPDDSPVPSGQDSNRLPYFGSGRPYRWQGFLIYFFMWIYGAILMLNALPVFNGSLAEETTISLAIRYLPNMSGFLNGMGIALMVLGAAMIVTRFLLARYLKCALPVFFAVSAADILLPLLIPMGMYIAMQPLTMASWWEMYSMFWRPEMRDELLYPLIVRLVLLICHGVYYYKRRVDFSN